MNRQSPLQPKLRDRFLKTDTHNSAIVIFGIFVGATLMLGTGAIAYDATVYWGGAQDIVAGALVFADMDFRGILTTVVYVPAAAVTAMLGTDLAPFAILLQNAIVLGASAVFLLPRLVRCWRPISSRAELFGIVLFWIVTVGFAPYALMDIYPILALFMLLTLFQSKRVYAMIFAGALAGIAINLRPAYLVPVILIALVAVVWRRWSSLLFVTGIGLGLVPQLLVNVLVFNEWTIWPARSGDLIALQTSYASYIVRYDTLVYATVPQQFYCSPSMATRLQAPLPTSAGELASTFLGNMPSSIVFSLEKISAALQWPHSNPYTVPSPGLDEIFAGLITAITIIGLLALLRISFVSKAKWNSTAWFNRAAFAALSVGTVLTLVSSATETRFGLMLVLLGVVGCMTLPIVSIRHAVLGHKAWTSVAILLVALVSFVGYEGLSHPAPAGGVNQSVCAALPR